jgi:hypothetical protein
MTSQDNYKPGRALFFALIVPGLSERRTPEPWVHAGLWEDKEVE